VIFWLNILLMLAAIAGLAFAGRVTARPHGRESRRADWIGFVLLATLMVALVFALHAAPHARSAPLSVVGLFALAAIAFVLLLAVESRAAAPLVDLSFFARRGFVMGVVIGSLSMFSIMSLLLYFNLYAQSREGLGHRQRLHLSWRQHRRRRRRRCVRAGRIRRRAGDDRARRHYRHRAEPRDCRDGIGGGVSGWVSSHTIKSARNSMPSTGRHFE
jgi:hypothetical protein